MLLLLLMKMKNGLHWVGWNVRIMGERE